MSQKEIILASPRGFCAGVNRAIDIVETSLKVFGPPVYVKHEIVHNQYVVKQLENRGVIFVNDIKEVPEKSTIIFSAHGVPPYTWEMAKERDLEIVDATCPLVTKVHLEAKRYAKENYQILLIGHINHVETIGTLGEAPERTTVIESLKCVEKLNFTKEDRIAYLTQTTLSVLDTREIIEALTEKFPWIESPQKSDICYATTNRQNAVQEIARHVQMILVIGSQNSSNSNRLRELSEKIGTPAHLIENSDAVQREWITSDINKIGVTSGASVPEVLVQGVIRLLQTKFNFTKLTEFKVTSENVTFKMPRKLKDRSVEYLINSK